MYRILFDNYFATQEQPIAIHQTHPEVNNIEHDHDFEELVIVDHGSGTHTLNGEPISIQSGDVFYIKQEDYHYYENMGELCLTNILIRSDVKFINIPALQQILSNTFTESSSSIYHLNIESRNQYNNLMSQLRETLNKNDSLSAVRREGLLLQLISLLSFHRVRATHAKNYFGIEYLLDELRCRHTVAIDWDKLCEKYGVSQRTLYRSMRKLTSYSPENYLLRLRLRTARHMLLFTDETITNVALESGFINPSHFSQCYKRILGISPTEERLRQQRHS
ncbi:MULTISPECIES: helix-turn-helix domain-containing protein [unclassified Raoultella]|uniref:helix-turn-helix domain-containing protein n=1 Tax=unclassified Raoultella TaxID=2627600 RepID=UPI001358E378|nr:MULTISPECIES: helix-turn-helix domain-containing protein [unclassified Raoultella]